MLPAAGLAADAEQEQPKQPKDFSEGVLIAIDGMITPMLEQYVYRKLEVAKQRGADLVILEIDSPGGLVDASLNLAGRLRDLDWAQTVVYVPRRALSGATIIALGADEIVMRKAATIGDAGPIFQGEDAQFRHAPEKIRSMLAREVRDLAEAAGRPPALAEAMVDMDLVVYRVKNRQTGEIRYMAQHEIDAAIAPGDWEKLQPVPESREGKFLTVSGPRAVELGLAEAVVTGRESLEQRYHLDDRLLVLEPTAVDTAVYILNLPVVTGLLFIIGLVALYVEFSAPGISIGGLLALLCFALFFWSRVLGGTAGWLEVMLFVTGVVFLLVEVFVIPGFGVAGLSGVLLLLASLVLAGQTFVVPKSIPQIVSVAQSLLVVLISGGVVLVAVAVLSYYFGDIPVLNRLALKPPEDAAQPGPGAHHGAPNPADLGRNIPVDVGDIGIADSPLRPAGKVRFGEEYVDVVTEGTLVAKGSRVKVLRVSGNRVVVREVG